MNPTPIVTFFRVAFARDVTEETLTLPALAARVLTRADAAQGRSAMAQARRTP